MSLVSICAVDRWRAIDASVAAANKAMQMLHQVGQIGEMIFILFSHLFFLQCRRFQFVSADDVDTKSSALYRFNNAEDWQADALAGAVNAVVNANCHSKRLVGKTIARDGTQIALSLPSLPTEYRLDDSRYNNNRALFAVIWFNEF